MNRFLATKTLLDGVYCIDRHLINDERGFFSRIFCTEQLSVIGWHWPISQINHTRTQKRGAVRGMHYQNPPYTDAKLVSCLKGSAWDVAVDIRRNSPTFLKWTAQLISAENHRSLLILPGFAHGFQALEDDTELLYVHSQPYTPNADAGLNPLDSILAINWPTTVTQLSEKDRFQPHIRPSFQGIRL